MCVVLTVDLCSFFAPRCASSLPAHAPRELVGRGKGVGREWEGREGSKNMGKQEGGGRMKEVLKKRYV